MFLFYIKVEHLLILKFPLQRIYSLQKKSNPMAEILLANITGITETNTDITISKSMLAATGYTPRTAMSLEEFVVALINKMALTFTQDAQDADSDRQIVIEVPSEDDISLSGTSPNRYADFDYTISLRKPAPTITFTPADF